MIEQHLQMYYQKQATTDSLNNEKEWKNREKQNSYYRSLFCYQCPSVRQIKINYFLGVFLGNNINYF
jgi:capsule polysaccharide modification protein KpsS